MNTYKFYSPGESMSGYFIIQNQTHKTFDHPGIILELAEYYEKDGKPTRTKIQQVEIRKSRFKPGETKELPFTIVIPDFVAPPDENLVPQWGILFQGFDKGSKEKRPMMDAFIVPIVGTTLTQNFSKNLRAMPPLDSHPRHKLHARPRPEKPPKPATPAPGEEEPKLPEERVCVFCNKLYYDPSHVTLEKFLDLFSKAKIAQTLGKDPRPIEINFRSTQPHKVPLDLNGKYEYHDLIPNYLPLDGQDGHPLIVSMAELVHFLGWDGLPDSEYEEFLDILPYVQNLYRILKSINPSKGDPLELEDLLAVIYDSGWNFYPEIQTLQTHDFGGKVERAAFANLPELERPIVVNRDPGERFSFPARLTHTQAQRPAFEFKSWADFLSALKDPELLNYLPTCLQVLHIRNQVWFKRLIEVHRRLNSLQNEPLPILQNSLEMDGGSENQTHNITWDLNPGEQGAILAIERTCKIKLFRRARDDYNFSWISFRVERGHVVTLSIGGAYGGMWPSIKDLPPEIGNLVHLKQLNISYTPMDALPEEIGNCIHLQRVYIHATKIKRLPASLLNWQELSELEIHENWLEELPSALWSATQLEKLKLLPNPFIPEHAFIANQAMIWGYDWRYGAILGPGICYLLREFYHLWKIKNPTNPAMMAEPVEWQDYTDLFSNEGALLDKWCRELDINPLGYLAVALLNQKRYDVAREFFTEIRRRYPQALGSDEGLAWIDVIDGNYRSAEQYYLERYEGKWMPMRQYALPLGILYEKKGDYPAAQKFLDAALDRAPHDADVLFYLGVLSIDLKDFRRARQYFREALEGYSNQSWKYTTPHEIRTWLTRLPQEPWLPTTRPCPQCSCDLPAGAKFCNRCGAKLV